MARLPTPGQDSGSWGSVLNDFLDVEHNSDGTLRANGTLSNYYIKPSTGIPKTDLAPAVQTSLGAADTALQPSIATTKGDLIAASGSATVTRLGAGSNGQTLVADSTQATGLAWKRNMAGMATNVMDYGATGNGSTDDTAAIQSAITAAKTSTQALFFPPGNYLISSTLNVGGGFPGGLCIFGSGWNSQISLANNANCYIFSLGNVYTPGLIIRDIFLSCNGSNQTSDSGGIDAYGAVSCLFENIQIDTPFYDGIYLHKDGTGGFGHDNTISSCLFNNGKNAGTGLGQALEIFESDENYVVNCTFGDNGNPNYTYSLHNGGQPGGTVYQVFESAGLQHFLNNSFVNGGQGVTMMRVNGSRCTIANNIFDGGSGQQLHINGNANTVMGNIFCNIGSAATSGNQKAGVYLDSKPRNMISGNVFSPIASGQGYATAGIWTDFGADSNDIVNNEFSLDGITGVWQYGPVRLNNGGGHNNIAGNNGFTTVAVGSASITNVQTSVVVSHGLALTPTNVVVTPQSSLAGLSYWVSGVGATQFTINVSATPGSTTTFYWQTQVLQG
ncbi:MAG: glycosyl hydrolase family 28-related protein [Candidatus Saccharibacteria bacterium]